MARDIREEIAKKKIFFYLPKEMFQKLWMKKKKK